MYVSDTVQVVYGSKECYKRRVLEYVTDDVAWTIEEVKRVYPHTKRIVTGCCNCQFSTVVVYHNIQQLLVLFIVCLSLESAEWWLELASVSAAVTSAGCH